MGGALSVQGQGSVEAAESILMPGDLEAALASVLQLILQASHQC